MLCNHCGADEPEIKIGAKSFCSSCGLPLGNEEQEQKEPDLPSKSDSGNELFRAFSKMSNSLSAEDGETSYKSSNIGFQKETSSPSGQNIAIKKVSLPATSFPKTTKLEANINVSTGLTHPQNKKELSIPTQDSKDSIKEFKASEKLLDILQEKKDGKEEKNKEAENKGKEKQKIKEVYESAERLLDILKDIPEVSEKPKISPKTQKEGLSITSPLEQKELASPLETKELPTKAPPIVKDEEPEELPKEIHNLGDKSGHIDHWEEEEVKKLDTSELKEGKHPLTNYFENILEKEKTKGEKTKKSKKNEKNSKKKNHKIAKVTAAFVLSAFLILAAIALSTQKPSQNIREVKSKALGKIDFEFVTPRYLPEGFEESLPIEADTNSLLITYSYIPDKSKKIILKEDSKLPSLEGLENYIKTQGGEYEVFKTRDIGVYYTRDQATFKNDKVWFTIKTNFDIGHDKLKKIAESLL